MGWSKDHGTAAKVNAEYAKEQGNVAKQEATNLAELKSNVEAATQNASTAAENANAVIVDANTAASNADSAASEAIAQANHAKNEGDRAKAEADRLVGTDVSVLDNKITEVTTQLAQTAQNASNPLTIKTTYLKRDYRAGNGCVVLTDDGGRLELIEHVKPILDMYGFKASVAQECNTVGKTGHLTPKELGMLQKEGHEIMSHSLTHSNGALLSQTDVIKEFVKSKELYKSWGVEPKNYVYPYNSYNLFMQRNILKYYRSACTGHTGDILYPPFDHTALNRTGIGAYQNFTLTQLKQKCLTAKETGGLLILMSHVGFTESGSGAETVEDSYRDLIELLHYCGQNGIDIIRLDDALDRCGNKEQIGAINDTAEGWRIVDCNGKLHQYNMIDQSDSIFNLPYTDYQNLIKPIDFRKHYRGKAVIMRTAIGIAHLQNAYISSILPVAQPGVLSVELNSASGSFDKRTYHVQNSAVTYVQWVIDDNTWSDWRLNQDIISISASKLKTLHNPKDYHPLVGNGVKIIRTVIGVNDLTNPNIPTPIIGVLTTEKMSDSGIFDRRKYELANKRITYVQFATADGNGWTPWEDLSSPSGYTSQRPTVDEVGYMYFDSTIKKPIWWSGVGWVDSTGATV